MDAYEHQRALGKGAMGSVALVRRKADGELLALKSMAVHSAKDRALARNEIEILRKLSHPHVVRFEDTFVLGQDVCIVMQFCEGGDLARLIGEQRSAGRRLPEAEVRGLLAQLGSALAHMHALRIVHRDIKSSNVFLLGANAALGGALGATRHALLGDFGVSKASLSLGLGLGLSLTRTLALTLALALAPALTPSLILACPRRWRARARWRARSAARRTTCRPRCATAPSTTRRRTCGPSACWHTSSARCATPSPRPRCPRS